MTVMPVAYYMIHLITTSQSWRIHPRPQAAASSALLREVSIVTPAHCRQLLDIAAILVHDKEVVPARPVGGKEDFAHLGLGRCRLGMGASVGSGAGSGVLVGAGGVLVGGGGVSVGGGGVS
ncbi:hypothetical protein ACFLTC_01065, partial [Chloroflexota bacterium]